MSDSKQNSDHRAGLTRRDALRIGAATTAALAAGAGFGPKRASAQVKVPAVGKKTPPNVLLIVTDQQHADTLGSGGCAHVATPGQDHLAARGVRFPRCYSTNPICSPARSSIFTGRMASETGVFENGRPIHPSVPNLGQWLSEQAGYETVYTGKWHLPGTRTKQIPGFRVPVTGISGQGNLCDTSVSLGCEGFLRNRGSDRPFLLVASFLQPHDICQWLRINLRDGELRYPELLDALPPLPGNFDPGPDEAEVLRQMRRQNEPGAGRWSQRHWQYYLWSYYRMIEQLDAEIARVHRALEESGQAENTLVMLVSDHGEGLARHAMVRKNFLYDESARVPFLVSFAGRAAEGPVCSEPVSQLDMVSTICDYAGIDAPPLARGRSLRPVLEQSGTLDREFVVAELSHDHFARMVRTERFKYIRYAGEPVEQLFDMRADPGETTNLARDARFAADLAAHRRMLDRWERGLALAPDLPEDRVWRAGA